jgi:hypothetical protein
MLRKVAQLVSFVRNDVINVLSFRDSFAIFESYICDQYYQP